MTRPILLVFPGASLMDIHVVPEGVRVACPGCGVVQVFTAVGVTGSAAFVHEDDCPVHARIREAIRRYERATGAEKN